MGGDPWEQPFSGETGDHRLRVLREELGAYVAARIVRICAEKRAETEIELDGHRTVREPPAGASYQARFPSAQLGCLSRRSERAHTSMGNVTSIVVPPPAGLCTRIVPPMASTRSTSPVSPEPLDALAPPLPSSATLSASDAGSRSNER